MLNNQLKHTINLLIFSFFTTILLIRKSYYIPPLILLLIAIFFIAKFHKQIDIPNKIKIYSMVCISYSLLALFIAIIHNDPIPSSFKAETFAALTVPIIILFSYTNLNLKIIALSLSSATILAGCKAIYDKFVLGLERALSESAVHVVITGGIVMTMAMLCCAISIYYLSQKHYKNAIVTGFAAIMGVLASILTGSRGSWLVFPFIIILLFIVYWKSLKKAIPIIGICLISGITILALSPDTGISKRYHQAIYDITHYAEQTEKTTSIGMRFELWKSAWYGFLEKPILGWGKAGMFEAKKQQVEQNIIIPYTLSPHLTHAHNQFLEQMFFRGLLGLLVLLAILFIPLIHFINSFRQTMSS
ncbi:O-antigen ligase family protein, partial [Pasteurellaceae bacterium Phil11]